MHTASYTPLPECPALAARGNVSFTCHPADLGQLADYLIALGFLQVAPAHPAEYGRWRAPDHESLLVAWKTGSILCQGRRPSNLASLLRSNVRDLQPTLFDLDECEVA